MKRSRCLQSLMLRYLTSIPPGKVRFTIVDPVGLGENFAAFMHLGDYHELLVTNRIWTEAPHIEQRLTDLTEHMENVIQKYLRNEFETIEEYNTMAGEVAEPFRILVVANFPTNFNDAALRRLISIVNSGARCGVYALVMLDTKLGLPSGFPIKELENPCVNMIWKEGRLQWREPNFGRYPLSLDGPPDPGAVLRDSAQGRQRRARRQPGRGSVRVHRAQARPVLDLRQQQGRRHSPGPRRRDQAAAPQAGQGHFAARAHRRQDGLRQVDDAARAHHQRGAAIQPGPARAVPDRLQERRRVQGVCRDGAAARAGDRRRERTRVRLERAAAAGRRAQGAWRNLPPARVSGPGDGYREARPEVPMPRVLLVIDEFQEFFVEDDKIAQEVTLLLDRLVRQGRAFGMHVILGSQTLGGQYSLPKATLGQMAVRIALQCSEADAHLILSEDNTAARLLTRPGEAIYNDANGMMEGNNLFQVVWLSDERREKYLERIQEMKREQNIQKPPPIVFEGNLPAEVGKNPLLNELLRSTEWPEAPKADSAWLGDAISIKDPTSVVFRPQSGSNVLIVGQNDEAALAMMIMARGEHRLAASAGRPAGVPASTCSTAARSIRRSPGSSAGSRTSFRTRSPT